MALATLSTGFTETIVPGSPATPIFMLNKSFGIHETWAHRWAYGLFAHRASFQGEAQVVQAVEPEKTLPCLRENLESAWVRFQSWSRAAEAKQEVLAASLLQLPLEELLSSAAEWSTIGGSLGSDTVQAYLANCEQVVQDRRRKEQERRDLARNLAKFLFGDWSSQASKRKCACKTHKESVAAVRTASRSDGFLHRGFRKLIGALREVTTAETLSQRYCFLVWPPELQTLVHADTCHVSVFSLCQATSAPHRLSRPALPDRQAAQSWARRCSMPLSLLSHGPGQCGSLGYVSYTESANRSIRSCLHCHTLSTTWGRWNMLLLGLRVR